MTEISVTNRQRAHPLDVKALHAFAAVALKCASELPLRADRSLSAQGALDIVLVSDRRMANLHRRFMSISGPTDVLTFHHGEIVISVDTAARNARAFSSSLDRELRLYIVHGLLHLHGFDDRTNTDAERMGRAQERVLAQAERCV